MALQTIKGGGWIPDPFLSFASGVQMGVGATIDASTELCAFIIQIPKSGDIRTIGFRTGTVTVNALTRLSATLETVSATNGDPTGTGYGGVTIGLAGAAPTTGTWNSITLAVDATATIGDTVAVVIGFGTFVAADSVVVSAVTSSTAATFDFPYVDAFVGGAWAKSSVQTPIVSLGYSDGTYEYIQGTLPISAITNQSYASNTAVTDEYALSFSVPWPCRLRGVAADIDGDGDYEVILYTGTTATATLTIDKDIRATATKKLRYFRFPTGPTLVANTTYRLGIRPTTTTAIVLAIVTVNAAAILDQMNGGQSFCLGTRLDQGSWAADTTTQRPMIFLQFDQFSDGIQAGASGTRQYHNIMGGM